MAGITLAGHAVNAGDEINFPATVTAISGTGRTATVTATTYAGETVTFKAQDCYGPQTDGVAISHAGKGFSVGDTVSVMGTVSSLSGSGKTAQLTVTTKSSSTTVVASASAVHTSKKS
jgi:hypothetical protein